MKSILFKNKNKKTTNKNLGRSDIELLNEEKKACIWSGLTFQIFIIIKWHVLLLFDF